MSSTEFICVQCSEYGGANRLMPVRLRHINAKMFSGLLYVGEGQVAVGIGDIFNLVEAGDRVPHVGSIGHWFLACFGKGESGFRESVGVTCS